MLNKICLMGRLTAAPALKETPGGTMVCTFTIAVERNYSKEKTTDFIDVVAWRQAAEFAAKYFTKGQLVAVDGSLQTRSYTDKDGNKRKAFEVVADNLHFAEKKVIAPEPANSKSAAAPDISYRNNADFADFEEIVDDNDLPF